MRGSPFLTPPARHPGCSSGGRGSAGTGPGAGPGGPGALLPGLGAASGRCARLCGDARGGRARGTDRPLCRPGARARLSVGGPAGAGLGFRPLSSGTRSPLRSAGRAELLRVVCLGADSWPFSAAVKRVNGYANVVRCALRFGRTKSVLSR